MDPVDWTKVHAARVLVTVAVGSATVRRSVEASVGPS
jgi:hypothetical protein